MPVCRVTRISKSRHGPGRDTEKARHELSCRAAGFDEVAGRSKDAPDLKLHDRKSDVALGTIYEQQINAFFEPPEIVDRSTIFFRAIEIANLIFSLSALGHRKISHDMEEEAKTRNARPSRMLYSKETAIETHVVDR